MVLVVHPGGEGSEVAGERSAEQDEAAPGRLIAVVGLDGAGKSTQVVALADWLVRTGVPARAYPSVSLAPVRTALTAIAREDGYTDHLDLVGAETMRLISACSKLARVAPLREELRTSPHTAVVDRFTYCQYALANAQKAGDEVFLRRLFRGLPEPDLTIFLDVDPEIAAGRIARRGIDTESVQFLHRFREAYLALEEFPRFVRVDGNGDQDTVQRALRAVVGGV